MLTDFHFLQPWALLLFPLLVVLLYFTSRASVQGQHWRSVCDEALLPLLEMKETSSTRSRSGLFLLIALLLTLAVAQPVWRQQPQPVFKQPEAVVIALDLSLSMYAADLKPNRLQRARFKIQDLLDTLDDAQVALVVYAADAFSVTPLTEDLDAVAAQLEALTPEIMPAQGSRADRAILLAETLLSQAGIVRGNILLVSDAVSPGQIAAAATTSRQAGRRLSILAVGTEQGAPVYLNDQPLRDNQGQTLLAQLLLDLMQEAAGLGGGQAVLITAGDQDIKTLLSDFQSGEVSEARPGTEVQRWVAEGPWFVLAALLLSVPLFRRGLLNVMLPVVLVGVMTYHTPVMAAEAESAETESFLNNVWQSLWQTGDQRGYQAYQQDRFAEAAQTFETPGWKQAALYKNADYEAALDALPAPESAAQWYNRGNVLAQLGQFEDAISAYQQALKMRPAFPDARYNLDLVKQLLEQKQKQQAQEQGGASQESNEDQQGEDSEQESSEGGGSMDQNFQQQGAQGGSSQNGRAQSGDFSNQTQESQQQAQSRGAGNQSASRGDTDPSESDEAERQAALRSQLKSDLDEQLEQQKSSSEGQQSSNQENGQSGEAAVSSPASAELTLDEETLAREQMLNQVQEDPSGLWRRKFLYQYRNRAEQHEVEAEQW